MPAAVAIDEVGNPTLEIPDAEGRVLPYAVEFLPPGLDDWAVRLHGGGGPYRVCRKPRGRWECSCPAFRYRFGCKHLLSVKPLYLALKRAAPHVRTPEEQEEARCNGTHRTGR